MACSGEPNLRLSNESIETHADHDPYNQSLVLYDELHFHQNETITLQELPTEILAWTLRKFLTFEQVAELRQVSVILERVASNVLRLSFLKLRSQIDISCSKNIYLYRLLQREYLLLASIFSRQMIGNFIPPAIVLDEFTKLLNETDNESVWNSLKRTEHLHILNSKIINLFEKRYNEPTPSRLIQILHSCCSMDYQLIITRDKTRCHIIGHFTYSGKKIASLPKDQSNLNCWIRNLRILVHEWNRETAIDHYASREDILSLLHVYELSEDKTRSLMIREGACQKKKNVSRLVVEVCCPIDEAPQCILESITRKQKPTNKINLPPVWIRDNTKLPKQNLINIQLL